MRRHLVKSGLVSICLWQWYQVFLL